MVPRETVDGADNGSKDQPFPSLSAEAARTIIRHLTQRERSRLGMLLARADVLPGYRVVKATDYQAVSPEGLSGQQSRLFAYCQAPRRITDVLCHLWPADADKSLNLGTDARLQSRLRVLVHKANRNLTLFSIPYVIIRMKSPRGRELFARCLSRHA